MFVDLGGGGLTTQSIRVPPGVSEVRVGVVCQGVGEVAVASPFGSTGCFVSLPVADVVWCAEPLAVDVGYRWAWRSVEIDVTLPGFAQSLVISGLLIQPKLPAREGTERQWSSGSWEYDAATSRVGLGPGAARSYDRLGFWVSVWARWQVQDPPAVSVLLCYGYSADDRTLEIGVAADGTSVHLIERDSGGSAVNTVTWATTWTTGTWRHLLLYVAPHDHDVSLLWVNGSAVARTGLTFPTPTDLSATLDLVAIGSRVQQTVVTGSWYGWIGDVAIYGREVTPSATALYAGGAARDWRGLPSWPGMREYWVPGSPEVASLVAPMSPWSQTSFGIREDVAIDSEAPTA
jgi:hypothetical protein